MKNYRGTGDRVVVNVGGTTAITSGQLVYRDGMVGVAETSGAINTRVALRIVGEFEFASAGVTGTVAKGNRIVIARATGALTAIAPGTAVPVGSTLVGIITATPTDTNTAQASGSNLEPKTGKFWLRLGGAPETA